jgi:hypothetical protein
MCERRDEGFIARFFVILSQQGEESGNRAGADPFPHPFGGQEAMAIRRRVTVTVLASSCLSLPGCASVTIDLPGRAGEAAAPQRVAEHEGLADASRALDAHLPEAASTGEVFGRIVFGGRDAALREEASAYLAGLEGEPLPALLADVDACLARGRAVAEAGRLAGQALHPTEGDVALLEAAVADLRRGRALYAEALKMLAEAGAPVEKADIRVVKDAFSQGAEDVGLAADLVAARLRDDAAPRFATPASGAAAGY